MTNESEKKKRRPDASVASYGKGASKRIRHSLEPGDRGVLLSSGSPTRTRESIREFLEIVSQLEGKIDRGSAQKERVNQAGESICESSSGIDELENSITTELESLANKKDRFLPIREIVRCVSFVKFRREEDTPSRMVLDILASASSGQQFLCKYLTRIVPLDTTCKPFAAHFEKAVTSLIASSMPESAAATKEADASETSCEEGVWKSATGRSDPDGNFEEIEASGGRTYVGTWSCRFNSRNISTLKKSEVLDIVSKLVGPKYKVDITKADYTIIVEVAAPFCGVSILKDYCKLANLNISTLVHKKPAMGEKGEGGGEDSSDLEKATS